MKEREVLVKYKVSGKREIDFGNMDNTFFLIGLLNEFVNRFQTTGDHFFGEVSWKQSFLMTCVTFFEIPPTLKELSELVGSSHQNIKQMLLKLEKAGYVEFMLDQKDRRKRRIVLTKKAEEFSRRNDKPSEEFMKQLFDGIAQKDLENTVKTIMQLDDSLKRMQETVL